MLCKLKGATKNYIWGGKKLSEQWHKTSEHEIIAESWDISTHLDGVSGIIDCDKKEYIGKKLTDVIPRMSVLIKLIDAHNKLSVQVHPDDAYAKLYENDFGKTEFWYVADCEKDAFLYLGFKETVNKEQLLYHIRNNSLETILNKRIVKRGESYFIPAGTVHAIGGGITICEVQQRSNLTYRLYDYGRIDSGKLRPLHIEKALDVANLTVYEDSITVQVDINTRLLAKCEYFTVYECKSQRKIAVKKGGLAAINIIEGEGSINKLSYRKGDAFLTSADAELTGESVTFLLTLM